MDSIKQRFTYYQLIPVAISFEIPKPLDYALAEMKWITYKTKKILYVDWKGLKGDEAIPAVTALEQEYRNHSPGSIRVLLDITNSVSNEEVVKKLSTMSKNSPAYAVAIVGFNAIKRLIASKIREDVFFARDSSEAKEWLSRR